MFTTRFNYNSEVANFLGHPAFALQQSQSIHAAEGRVTYLNGEVLHCAGVQVAAVGCVKGQIAEISLVCERVTIRHGVDKHVDVRCQF